ncbi:MAG: methionyl-tRNA formyltransferase [Clostridia bacterium]|nr:methionyl-tRNA formyltransferase [Clostridia bacterium]
MKTVYMGTPDFAVEGLQALYDSGHEIGMVITQPDKARDRGKKFQPTPVKERALSLGLEVLQPEKIKGNTELFRKLRAYEPDLIVVAAYGKILPKELLEIPKKGCINIHASLLPRFRGAAPIQRSIIEGDEYTGITLMYIEEGLDTGDMIAKVQTPIASKDAGELHDELAVLGAELLKENLPAIEAGTVSRQKQDDSKATYAPMLFKKDGLLDFTKSPEELERLIRGTAPWPGAYTNYNGETLKIWKAAPLDDKCEAAPGEIVAVSPEGIDISCGGKILRAEVIQLPGKRKMAVSDYLRGNAVEKGTVLG